MRSFIFIVFFLFLITNNVMGQSIRKNHNEMTTSEKNALVAAFVALRNGVFGDLADVHSGSFSEIHFNLANGRPNWNPAADIFFPWHRRQILELEQAMQALNSKITIPTWDWVVDNSASDALWNSSFMGSFNSWGLNRKLTGNRLPSASLVASVQNINPGTPPPNYEYYVDYSHGNEDTDVHKGGHIWVGGTMNSPSSLTPIPIRL